ncbi:8-amino-7-oxononanoate synthase [Verrucomicrobiaceae bacterium N1E253]|uniref:8-amino-7-oxononanoate synthase n=1 Tax=Oceaniferula marina TaxID=2748318 RepID=A0A851GQT1_9BACT|nr:8-amino-7-oxononanoate synthase [Oceaniferula marina]NWK56534.1 8-amino-7-oxononanoate synthase [Oceaniferula marina]
MRKPEDELAQLQQASLLRSIPDEEASLINFASNDYLGLARHPGIAEAWTDAIQRYGNGSTASRLICGTSPAHRELESTLAEAKGTEAAISFATGYSTSVGILTSLLQKGDTVILDKLCHASLIDGARMSGATIRVFPHNHLPKLRTLLTSTADKASSDSRTLVVTESIFSMDGDAAPLKEISDLCKEYQALLMVDEAHGLGILGPTGMGLAEKLGLQGAIDFHMGTLGKAAGVGGGYLAAKQIWVDLFINRARSFIYSTAPPPAQAAASAEAIRIIRSQEGAQLRQRLWQNISTLQDALQLPKQPGSAIIPWMIGESKEALQLSKILRDLGMRVPAIRYPTVPRKTARLRITLSAAHNPSEISELAKTLIDRSQ